MQSDVNLLQSQTITYAIDASSANKEKRTGVENYAFHLIEAMKHEPLLEGERVVLFSSTILQGALASLPTEWESRVLNWSLPLLKKSDDRHKFSTFGWMQGRVSWELLRRRPNVLFVPAQGLPRFFFGTPVVTTVHDIAFRRISNLYDPKARRRIASATKRSIKRASHLLVVSAFTHDEVHDVYHVKEERMTITPLSADLSVYRRMDNQTIESVLRKYRLGHNFFLFVGRLEKKKNVATLIRAFELFKQNRGIGDPFELVLAGEPGYGYDEIKTYIDRSLQHELIREIGYVADEEVAALMNVATALCFPSWYEGFGIPNLEAMACGTVLLTSDISVHHEVAGEAAVFISPKDPDAWARQMGRLVDDSTLHDQLIENGTMRVCEFSWQRTAVQTWAILRSLVTSVQLKSPRP
jgi:glycosyltransferase involved in cell wall biosynthesis